MSSYPRVLVSILSYNSSQNTLDTIKSIQNQDYPFFHLQLIDNASAEGFIDEIRQNYPNLDVKILTENIGYTGGNNIALRQGLEEGYDYVLIANHDIELDANAISLLVETAEKNNDAALVGGIEVCYFSGEVVLVERTGFSFWFMRPQNSSIIPCSSQSAIRVQNVQGALILFTRRALESGLLWDENLFMYYDEVDMGLDIEKLGLSAYVDLRVKIRHKNKVKFFNPQAGYCHQRNRLYLSSKHGKWFHRVFYVLYSTFFEIPLKMIVRVVQGRSRYAKACLLGQLDGISKKMGRGRITQI